MALVARTPPLLQTLLGQAVMCLPDGRIVKCVLFMPRSLESGEINLGPGADEADPFHPSPTTPLSLWLPFTFLRTVGSVGLF